MKSTEAPIRVGVAMSGGVDSSVTAALLCDEGYDVIGLTMKLFTRETTGSNAQNERGCCNVDAILRAEAVCHKLGIPHYSVDVIDEFRKFVISDFVDEYIEGRTPNPCVRCNTFLKWGVLYDKARRLGCDYLATGHYARIVEDQGEYALWRAVTRQKDQSYALWGIPRQLLQSTLLPLGGREKTEVRRIAGELGLKSAETPESQEICFIPDNDYCSFLKREQRDYFEALQEGEIVEITDAGLQKVGSHQGHPFYTIGQRKGLGGGFSSPRYVIDIDAADNRITIGPQEMLLRRSFIIDQVNWLVDIGSEPIEADIQVRYHAPTVAGRVGAADPKKRHYRVELNSPMEAIAPGQSAVFYHGDQVLGGGRIIQVLK